LAASVVAAAAASAASAAVAEALVLVQLQGAAEPLLLQAQAVAELRLAARRPVEVAVSAASAVSVVGLLPSQSYSAVMVGITRQRPPTYAPVPRSR
jgi:hypothetical protein